MKKNHEILDEVMGTLKSTPDLSDSQYHYVKLAMDEFAQQQSDYWKKRCEAVEGVIDQVFNRVSMAEAHAVGKSYHEWQELKNKNL